MAKGGGKKRSYVRDGNGRFASTPGGGKSAALKGGTLSKRSSLKSSKAKLKAKDAADPSIRNTLSTRAQKGAVTRGNKALRAAKASSQRTVVGRSKTSTLSKAKRSPVLKATVLKPQAAKVPAAQRPGSMTSTLRATMGALAKADAKRIREIESITGQKVRPKAADAKAGKEAGARVRATAKKGKVADTLRAGLRELAQSDARTMRGMAEIVRDATPKVSGGKSGKALNGAKKALPVALSKQQEDFLAEIKRTGSAGSYERMLKHEIKMAKARKAKAEKLAKRGGANSPSGSVEARRRRVGRLQGVSKRIGARARRIYENQFERVGMGSLPSRDLFAAPMGRKSTGTNAATGGLFPGSKTSLPRTRGTVAKPKGLKPSPVSKAAAKPVKAAGQFRSRKQAAQAQREKARILGEVGRNAPGAYGPMERRGSMKIKYGASKQMNIYGGVDTVKNRKSITFSDRSVIGDSARLGTVKKKAISADNRVVKLNNQRSEQIAAMTTKDFRRNSEANQKLAKTEKSIRTLKKASDYYVDRMSSASKSRPRKPRKFKK